MLDRQLARRVVDHLGATVVAELRRDLVEVLLDERKDPPRTREDRLELGDELDRLAVVVVQLLALESREPAELHLQDGLGLRLGEPEPLAHLSHEQDFLALVRADELDDLVDMVVRDLESLEDVRSFLRLPEVVVGAAADDLAPVIDVVLQDLLQRKSPRLLVDEREHVEVERRLHRGVLEQVVQHERLVVVSLDLDDDAHALSVALVADVRDPRELLVLYEVRDLLDERGFVHRVRQLGDDDRVTVAPKLLVVRLRARDDATATLSVRAADRVDTLGRASLDVALLVET